MGNYRVSEILARKTVKGITASISNQQDGPVAVAINQNKTADLTYKQFCKTFPTGRFQTEDGDQNRSRSADPITGWTETACKSMATNGNQRTAWC